MLKKRTELIAIYHASFQTIKRSENRSAVAAIAYRSGERLLDERTGEVHDYSRKGGVADTFILAPSDVPDWASDRAKLWNEVEKGEKRKDAQLARELNVALPRELTDKDSVKLLKSFVKKAFVDKGMVADVALHDMKSDNPHAHIMLTMRAIGPDGFGEKNRGWNHKKQLIEWREDWAVSVNHQLEVAGHDARIDHRSLKAQGTDRVPTIHMGVHANAMEKDGIVTPRGDRNRAIAKANRGEATRNIGKLSPAEVALAKLDELIEKTKAAIQAARDTLAPDPMSVIDNVLGDRSVLSESLKKKDAEKVQERERKQQERSMNRSGPSRGR